MSTNRSTEEAPDDSPPIVTFFGSPLNAWMFFCTHSSASRWSRKPGLDLVRGRAGELGKPNTAHAELECKTVAFI